MNRILCTFLLLTTSLFAHDPLLDRASLPLFKEVISKEAIETRIHEVAQTIDATYQDQTLTIVMLMKGAICVTADLMRALNTPSTLDFIQTSSYGAGGTTRGELTLLGLDKLDLEGRDVLVVDDIYDSGATLAAVVEQIGELNPSSVRSFVLLVKNREDQTYYRPDFIGFEVDDLFVVGYGMDYKELWRDLPAIYSVEPAL